MRQEVIAAACRRFGTPFYLLDLEDFRERIRSLRDVLGDRVQLCYAVKANPFLIRTAAAQGLKLEVCSPGEFAICGRLGIPMEQIVLSGVYKEEKEILRVLKTQEGRGTYTVESLSQLDMLNRGARQIFGPDQSRKLRLLLRVTSGNQFGLDEEELCRIIRERQKYPLLDLAGIQYYSGTQKKGRIIKEELEYLDELLKKLEREWGYRPRMLEYGPGLPVAYFQKDPAVSLKEQADALKEMLDGMEFDGRITLELGRYLAAACGCYVTRLVDEKVNRQTSYGIVDGGIHHLNYYGQTMAMKLPFYQQLDGKTYQTRRQGRQCEVTVCGALCTVSDVLVKRMPLYEPYLGDLLVFENTGAYSITEGIYLFLSRALPRVISWSGEEGLRLVRDALDTSLFNGESG